MAWVSQWGCCRGRVAASVTAVIGRVRVVLIEGLWSNLSEIHQRDTWCAEPFQAHE